MARSQSIITTDHDDIRNWAEERGASPACVKRTGRDGDVGMIRLDFPGFSGEGSLETISWDEWFEAFDKNGLALLYQASTAKGQKSNFNKLISRETAQAQQQAKGSGRSARGSRSTTRRFVHRVRAPRPEENARLILLQPATRNRAALVRAVNHALCAHLPARVLPRAVRALELRTARAARARAEEVSRPIETPRRRALHRRNAMRGLPEAEQAHNHATSGMRNRVLRKARSHDPNRADRKAAKRSLHLVGQAA